MRLNDRIKACEKGDAASCVWLSVAYTGTKEGYVRGLKIDLKKALHYAKRACDLGDTDGCYFAGMTLYYGDDWGKIARDKEMGERYLRRACKLGKEDVCTYFAK